jgi:hypothetical protein
MRGEPWRALLLVVLSGGVPAIAGERTTPDDAAADLELLEYLGTLVQDGDEWVDPSDIAPRQDEAPPPDDDPLGLPPEWED